MRFADPWYLSLCLVSLPVFWFGQTSGGRIRYSSIETLKHLRSQSRIHPRQILLAIRCVAIILFGIALARPQAGKKITEVTSDGVDIMLALDTSGSMQGLDFKLEGQPASRLDVVKKVGAEFIRNRPGDRIGVVVFAEEAFTQCPLTLDHGIVIDFLNRLETGMAGDSTAIGSGIGTAINRMKDLKAKSKVIVLMTDGVNNAGRIPPLKAAELAQSFGIKVYTIGIGSHGEVPFLVNTPLGKQYIYQRADLDEDALKQIAQTTNAQYFRATDTNRFKEIYAEIDRLEKTEAKVKEYTEYQELFFWFALPALLLILGELLLGQTLLRKIP
jgi:Ca-activated chloride channel homolog